MFLTLEVQTFKTDNNPLDLEVIFQTFRLLFRYFAYHINEVIRFISVLYMRPTKLLYVALYQFSSSQNTHLI